MHGSNNAKSPIHLRDMGKKVFVISLIQQDWEIRFTYFNYDDSI